MVMIEDPSAPGYWIASSGRVLGSRGSWLKATQRGPYAQFSPGRGAKSRRVHVAVCETFHGPRPSPKHVVRHLNGNPLDNRSVNLAWGTTAENSADTVRHGAHRNQNTDKTHCTRGHPLDGDNLMICDGRRRCRTCSRAATRAWRKEHGNDQG